MENYFFENKKFRTTLTTWLDQEYQETSKFTSLNEVLKKRVFKYCVAIKSR